MGYFVFSRCSFDWSSQQLSVLLAQYEGAKVRVGGTNIAMTSFSEKRFPFVNENVFLRIRATICFVVYKVLLQAF